MRGVVAVLGLALALSGCGHGAVRAVPTLDAGSPEAAADATALAPVDASTATDDAASSADAAPDGLSFEKHTLDTTYRGEGVGVFDVDRDGHLDIVDDQTWYAGPDFTQQHEIAPPQSIDPTAGFMHGFGIYPQDVDGDGWVDAIVVPHHGEAMYWLKNPRGVEGDWTQYLIAPTGVAGAEYGVVVDLFADGTPVLVMGDSLQLVLGWYAPGSDPTMPWVAHAISAAGFPGAGLAHHGIGAGDVNGDGLLDVLTPVAWFQQTADRGVWIAHPFAASLWPAVDASQPPIDPSLACSRMWTYDVDGDGWADVLCTRPHNFGVSWLQQLAPDGAADPSFVVHSVDTTTVSQMHALELVDLDGDGVPELITGKRWYADLPPDADPGGNDPALLVYYTMRRADAGSEVAFEEHTIDDDSGIGAQFTVTDIDGDGRPDIVVQNKKGLYYFLQR